MYRSVGLQLDFEVGEGGHVDEWLNHCSFARWEFHLPGDRHCMHIEHTPIDPTSNPVPLTSFAMIVIGL
jgi:hypothetical protein